MFISACLKNGLTVFQKWLHEVLLHDVGSGFNVVSVVLDVFS